MGIQFSEATQTTFDAIVKQNPNIPQHFIQKCFLDINPDLISNFGETHISSVIKQLYTLYNDFISHNSTIVKTNKLLNSHAELIVITQNKSFIVDSLLIYFKQKGYYTNLLLHPTFNNTNETNTSIFYCVIENFTNGQSLLEKEVLDIMQMTHLVNKDWSKMKEYLISFSSQLTQSQTNFATWLAEEGFVFLGIKTYDKFSKHTESMGLCSFSNNIIDTDFLDNSKQSNLTAEVKIYKSHTKSPVHKENFIDIITFTDPTGASLQLYGLFTTVAYKKRIINIPLISEKANKVLEMTNFKAADYNYKEAVAFMDNLPRDNFFQADEKQILLHLYLYLNNSINNQNTVIINKDNFNRFFEVILFVSRGSSAHFIKENVVNYLCQNISSDMTELLIHNNQSNFITFQYIVYHDNISSIDLSVLQSKLSDIITPWNRLFIEASRIGNIHNINNIINFSKGLPQSYKSITSAQLALQDFNHVSRLSPNLKITSMISKSESDNLLNLRLYYLQDFIPLHVILATLYNFGLKIIREDFLSIQNNIFIHSLFLDYASNYDLTLFAKNFEQVLEDILGNKLRDSQLNQLAINPILNTKQITILRGYVKYLQQIGFNLPGIVVEKALVDNPEVTIKLIQLFEVKFDAQLTSDRKQAIKTASKQLQDSLLTITNSTTDRILKAILGLINATVRTNAYVADRDFISYKFDCSKIPNLPKPVPFREIFVYHKDFEAIHLRGGKVARGGLRWSDRVEDFRTEVLGLVKAQNTKNAVIVPVGSKGGFVIKADTSTMSREQYATYGKECYVKFLSGCLDITDNIILNKIVTPDNVIIYDEQDPYFVVAADKGTATFSDTANSISAKYNFWLGDAFASGGSNGYDHKKMGITAKGAWVALKRHFLEQNIHPEEDILTCVGIGDLSGDVFGNGVLLSKTIKLVGAFNHLHIFIDPTPDPQESYNERLRMFQLPRSLWTDYNTNVMSTGSQIYERSAKILKLTPQIKELFQLTVDEITPNELINTMLKAKVDFIWNGGIGTYIKATSETNMQVGDKFNDAVRVNGSELRCKVFAEGGNLGATQLGRIEACMNGIAMNTDSIDNSAGVDCSDHEVNIKITLNKLVADNKITQQYRDDLLLKMTDEVEQLVLRDNYEQTQTISIINHIGLDDIDAQADIIEHLESIHLLDRSNEFLPSRNEIERRKSEKKHLTRSELSILLSYCKMYAYRELLASNLILQPYFNETLTSYFPKLMVQKHEADILQHPLRNEIISTCITNDIVSKLGITFVYNMSQNCGVEPVVVIKAYIIAKQIFGIDKLFTAIESMDNKNNWQTQALLFTNLIHLCERIIFWFIKYEKLNDIKEMIDKYSVIISKLTVETLQHPNTITDITINLDIARICISNNQKYTEVQKAFAKLDQFISLPAIKDLYSTIVTTNATDRIAIRQLWEDILAQYTKIGLKMFELGQDKWVTEFDKFCQNVNQITLNLTQQGKNSSNTISSLVLLLNTLKTKNL